MRLAMIWFLAVGLFSFGGELRAQNSAYFQFRHAAGSKVCKERLDTLKDLKALFDLSELKSFLDKGTSEPLQKRLSTYSTDFLIKLSLELDQNYGVLCPEHKKAGALRDQFERAYLAQLGLEQSKL